MASKFVAFTSLGRRALPNQWDVVALSLIFGLFVLVVHASRGMLVPLSAPGATPITLDYAYLPYYALRTTLRMFLALGAADDPERAPEQPIDGFWLGLAKRSFVVA